MSQIDVSYVMTVYNKEAYLPSVLKALLNQTGSFTREYIFVDDCSCDRSVQIIEEMTRGLPHIHIIQNTHNRGISVRINQGIQLAKGTYIRMLDSDDIFPLDSTEQMMKLAKKHAADMVYGTFIKTGKEPEALTHCYMPTDIPYTYHKDALRAVLSGRFTRMGQLIKRQVLQAAHGADERVFIQDETIPLRAALLADGIIKMAADVVLVPRENGNLSGVKIQLDHDRFLAHYYFLTDHPELAADIQKTLYAKAVSDFWKYTRKTRKAPYLTSAFFVYLGTKLYHPMPSRPRLDNMAAIIGQASVLKVKGE